MRRRANVLTVFVIFVILYVSTLLLLLVFRSTFISLISKSSSETTASQVYQYQEFHYATNKITVGFSKVNQVLKEKEGFLSFKNSAGFAILSNFAHGKYECTGSCYCEDMETDPDINSRRQVLSSTVLTRGFSLLFSALSISMAMKVSKEVFQDRCIEQFSEVCEPSQIFSEVSECRDSSHFLMNKDSASMSSRETYIEMSWDHNEAENYFHDRIKKEIHQSSKLSSGFICGGYCIHDAGKTQASEEEEQECNKIRLDGVKHIKTDSSISRSEFSQLSDFYFENDILYEFSKDQLYRDIDVRVRDYFVKEAVREEMKGEFVRTRLEKFCKEQNPEYCVAGPRFREPEEWHLEAPDFLKHQIQNANCESIIQ